MGKYTKHDTCESSNDLCTDIISVLEFLVFSEFHWRHAEVVLDVLAKEGWIWETEAIADLLDAQVCLF